MSLGSYVVAMDQSIPSKIDRIMPLISEKTDILVDIGIGSGKISYILAKKFPDKKVIGIDIRKQFVDNANEIYGKQLDNLEYIVSDACEYASKQKNNSKQTHITYILCSILHEIYSYKDGLTDVIHLLSCLAKNNNCDVIIRDFIGPCCNRKGIILKHSTKDKCISFEKFYKDFKHFMVTCILEDTESDKDYKYYLTDMRSVYEYIYRKDYVDHWDYELNECYSFWTYEVVKKVLKDAGLQIMSEQKINNEWILSNRIQPYITLYDLNDKRIELPDYQILLLCRSK